MLVALEVAVLVVAVVWRVLSEDHTGRSAPLAVPLIAGMIGVLVLTEGALMLFKSPGLAADSRMTVAAHGVALVCAGAGIWGIAHRSRWYRQPKPKPAAEED